MAYDRRDELIDLIQKLQLEIGFGMETWADRLAAPIPRDDVTLAAHFAAIKQAAGDMIALTDAVEALRQRLRSGGVS